MAETQKSIWDALANAGLESLLGGNKSTAATPGPLSNESVQLMQQARQAPLLNTDQPAFDAAPAVNLPQRAPAPEPQGFGEATPQVNFNQRPSVDPLTLNQGEDPLRQQQIDKLGQLVAQDEAGPQSLREVDFAPIAALLDSQQGTNLAKSLGGNVNVDRRRKEIEALRKSLAGGKAQSTQDRRDARFLKSQQIRGNNNMRKDKNKLVDSLSKVKNSFNNLEDALDSNDFILLQNSLSNYARVISGEKGVLTDRDIVRVLPSTLEATMAKAKVYFDNGADIPPDLTRSLRDGIKIARKNIANVSNEQFDNLLGDAEFVGASPEFADKMRRETGQFVHGLRTRKRKPKKSQRAPKKKMSRLEELRAKKAGRL